MSLLVGLDQGGWAEKASWAIVQEALMPESETGILIPWERGKSF